MGKTPKKPSNKTIYKESSAMLNPPKSFKGKSKSNNKKTGKK